VFDLIKQHLKQYIFVLNVKRFITLSMNAIYNEILSAKIANKKLLAILIDPEKVDLQTVDGLVEKINNSPATHIFIGGSLVTNTILDDLIVKIKQNCSLPIVLFPGNPSQISGKADGILFLSLLSGRNPDYLIEHQVNAVPNLNKTKLEIISTGYILIESGTHTAVEKVSKTKPLPVNNPEYILQTAQAGEMLGNKLIYLEAGSGAKNSVPQEIVKLVACNIKIPLIVGGGIRSFEAIENAYNNGADIVVIGTAFENDLNFFDTKNAE
jgi:putative glycerol-1-phosphate prenyltransferase